MSDNVRVVANAHYRIFNPGEVFSIPKGELDQELKRDRPRLRLAKVEEVPKKAEAKADKK